MHQAPPPLDTSELLFIGSAQKPFGMRLNKRLSVPHLCSSRDNPSRKKVPILSGHPLRFKLIGSAVSSN